LRELVVAVAAMVMLASAAGLAHERIIMGTIAAVRPHALDVRAKPEEENGHDEVVSVALVATTKYRKGQEPATRADLKTGLRVVVTVDHRGDGTLVAEEVRLPAVRASHTKEPAYRP